VRANGGSDGLEAAAVIFRAFVHTGDGMNAQFDNSHFIHDIPQENFF